MNLPAIQRAGFDPWVRKILWRGKSQPTPVFLFTKHIVPIITGPHRRITEGVKEKSGPGPALEEPSARSLPAGMCDGNSPPPRAPKGGKPRNTSVLPQAAVWELSTGEEGGVRAWPPGFWLILVALVV